MTVFNLFFVLIFLFCYTKYLYQNNFCKAKNCMFIILFLLPNNFNLRKNFNSISKFWARIGHLNNLLAWFCLFRWNSSYFLTSKVIHGIQDDLLCSMSNLNKVFIKNKVIISNGFNSYSRILNSWIRSILSCKVGFLEFNLDQYIVFKINSKSKI